MQRHVNCLIRTSPHYRRDAFYAGFKRLGYTVDDMPCRERKVSEKTILLVWNRYGAYDAQARMVMKAGGAVIVAENGYLPMKGTKKTFALALYHHNGAGLWHVDEADDRARLLDIELKPWQEGGDTILVLPQRGIGPPGIAMPHGWQASAESRLKRHKFRARQHPGTAVVKPLEQDLDNVKCAITWGSGAGLKALAAGVPVFHEFKDWIGKEGGCYGIEKALEPDPVSLMGDREAMLRTVARAQWSVEEVETGEPFSLLLALHRMRAK